MSYYWYSDQIIDDGAISYWRLNETSGTTAVDMKGVRPGTISGGVTLNQPGALVDGDKAMKFDGTTGRVATVAATLPVIFSVEAWVNSTKTEQMAVFSDRPNGTSGVFLGTMPSSIPPGGRLQLFLAGPNNFLAGTKVVTDGRWHHIVYTSNGTTIQTFVDGKLDGTMSLTRSTSTSAVWNLGYDALGAGQWQGSLDDVAVYPTVLTAAQVLSHYVTGLVLCPYGQQVITDGATAYWRLNESSGTTAASLISNLPGTISGGVTLNQLGAVSDGDASMLFTRNSSGRIVTASTTLPAVSSVEAWVKTTLQSQEVVFDNRSSTVQTNEVYLGLTNAGLSIHYIFGVGYTLGSSNLATGVWHHLVWVADVGGTRTYVDGVLETSSGMVKPAVTNPWNIGFDPGLDGNFDGLIDEVAVYPLALTASQVNNHFSLASSSMRKGHLIAFF